MSNMSYDLKKMSEAGQPSYGRESNPQPTNTPTNPPDPYGTRN